MTSKFKTSFFYLFITLITTSCTNFGNKSTEQTSANEPIYELDETFLKDYLGNQVGADNKYKNKTFRIKGIITEFSNFGGPTIHVYVADVDGTALCHFEESMSDEVGKLQGGQQVVIQGVFTSMITSIDFQNCEIKEVSAPQTEQN
jgi:hypothetical protein